MCMLYMTMGLVYVSYSEINTEVIVAYIPVHTYLSKFVTTNNYMYVYIRTLVCKYMHVHTLRRV